MCFFVFLEMGIHKTGIIKGSCETIELVNAVNGMEVSLHQASSSLTTNVTTLSNPNSHRIHYYNSQGYQDMNSQCMLTASHPDCWNTILENDLELMANPVNYSCQEVVHESSNNAVSCSCDECIVGNLMTNFIN